MKKNILQAGFIGIFILSFLLFCQSFLFHVKVLSIDSPLEYRENSTVVLTNIIQNHKVPYTKDVMPLYTNVYGIAYNAVMVPFVWLLGSSYGVFRGVNAFFFLASLAILFLVLKKKNVPISIRFLACILWYAQIVQSNFDILARPDGLGEMLFIASVVIPWYFAFSKKSLGYSILLAVAAFYTKPYFVIGGMLVGAYLFLFRSRKNGFWYLTLFFLLLLLLMSITQIFMEFYWYNVLLFHLKNARYMLNHLVLQTETFTLQNAGVFAILLCALILEMAKNKRKVIRMFPTMDYFVWIFISLTALVLGKLGGHDGNFMSYYTELLTPFLLIIACPLIYRYKKSIVMWLCIGANILILINMNTRVLILPEKEITSNWSQWRTLLDSYKDIYNAPPFAKYLLDTGKPIYDTGHTEYFTKSMSRVNFFLFDDARDVYNKHLHELDRKIQNEEFDLILILKNYVYYDFLYTGYLKYFIETHYSLKEIKPLIMYHDQRLLFEVWERKK